MRGIEARLTNLEKRTWQNAPAVLIELARDGKPTPEFEARIADLEAKARNPALAGIVAGLGRGAPRAHRSIARPSRRRTASPVFPTGA